MTRIKYDIELIRLISLFESLTGAKVKDCFFDGKKQLIFVVEKGDMAKAIGKNGANAKRVENLLNRKIKIVEFNPEVVIFAENLLRPLMIREIREDAGVVTLFGGDTKTKGLLIGRNSSNLKDCEAIIKRYFDIKSVKVL